MTKTNRGPRRREVTPDGIAYETCDPEPSDPKTKEAINAVVSAAVRHVREQQRPRWEYHRERWGMWPSMEQADQRLTNLGEDGWELVTISPCSSIIHHEVGDDGAWWALFKRQSYNPVGIDYTGDDPSVECAYPPCHNKLRRSDFDGPQWCSKEHRALGLVSDGDHAD